MNPSDRPAMQWSTPIDIEPIATGEQGLYSDKIMTLGSCFSEHIGASVRQMGYDVLINPFGTLYNPISICCTIESLLSDSGPDYTPYLVQHGDLYFSLLHHSKVHAPTRETLINQLTAIRHTARERLLSAQWLWITWGTTQTYYIKGSNVAVNNCQKQPGRLFNRRDASMALLIDEVSQTICHLRSVNPRLRIICTVSPVVYLHDGLSDSCLSKSKLRVLCDALSEQFRELYYFPAYEIQRDELRDYRYYAPNLTHPSTEAVSYIAQHFLRYWASTDPVEVEQRDAVVRLQRLSQHRPLSREGAEWLREQISRQVSELQSRYPHLILSHVLEQTLYHDLFS